MSLLPFAVPRPSAVPPLPINLEHLIRLLDPKVPFIIKQRVVESLLNHTFAEPLQEGEFDVLEGRRITLAIADLGIALSLTLEAQRLVVCRELGEATIRGGWREFLCLATRREDPDSLFFQRRLVIEGDTELGLTLKNLLDGREESFAQGRLGEVLIGLERFARRA
ncbi:MAG: ubiquinone anaerobic biosynthesis accessory factor UbiT [Pseudomonadota bacterium]